KASSNPRGQRFSRIELLHQLYRFHDHIANLEEGATDAFLGHVKNQSFRLVEEALDVLLTIVTASHDLAAYIDQTAQDCLLPHDASVVDNVGSAGDLVRQFGQIGRPTDLL